jgi:hypothetical protein
MGDADLPVCLPGLQGLPVQITGWDGFQEKEQILMKNDIHLQFGSGWSSGLESNTFFMNGTQYFVAALDFTQPKQEGLKTFSATPSIEIHIWGKPTATSLQKSFALLSVPVYYDSTKPISLLKLSDYLPQGPNVQIMKYSTCIETQKGTLQVNVAYWMSGMGINFNPPDPSKQFKKFGIQSSLLDNNLFLSSFKQMNDEKKAKLERVYKNKDGRSVPYSTTVKLPVTSPEFLKGFRMIQGFTAVESSKLADTSNYKCIAIKRTRDIKNGKLMVDPRTGKSLAEENEDMDEATKESLDNGPDKASNGALITLYVIIGLILGAFGIALIVYVLQFLIGRRSDVAGIAPVPIVAAAVAAAAPVGTGAAVAATGAAGAAVAAGTAVATTGAAAGASGAVTK